MTGFDEMMDMIEQVLGLMDKLAIANANYIEQSPANDERSIQKVSVPMAVDKTVGSGKRERQKGQGTCYPPLDGQ